MQALRQRRCYALKSNVRLLPFDVVQKKDGAEAGADAEGGEGAASGSRNGDDEVCEGGAGEEEGAAGGGGKRQKRGSGNSKQGPGAAIAAAEKAVEKAARAAEQAAKEAAWFDLKVILLGFIVKAGRQSVRSHRTWF